MSVRASWPVPLMARTALRASLKIPTNLRLSPISDSPGAHTYPTDQAVYWRCDQYGEETVLWQWSRLR